MRELAMISWAAAFIMITIHLIRSYYDRNN